MSTVTVRVGRRQIRVSKADKVLFPDDGITKGDLVDHYRRVAPRMLRFLRDRPVMLQRLPEGLRGEAFYQKEASAYFPGWIRRVRVRKAGGSVNHVVCDDAATLAYLAAQACVTPHVWLSRVDQLDRPDRMIIDVDPGGADTREARFAAGAVRDLLIEVGLTPYLMATGSRGFHVVVPLRRRDPFDEVRRVARELMTILADREPARLTVEARKDARRGRVYLDYLRNAYAQTAVPPYAVRPRPGAPVAMPLAWTELSEADPAGWSMRTLSERLREPDPWSDFARHARSLDTARQWLERFGPRGMRRPA